MTSFFRFIASPAGRTTRVVAGLVLIAVGLSVVGGTGGTVLALVGLLPLAAGLFDWCVFAPLAGLPFAGKALRQRLAAGQV